MVLPVLLYMRARDQGLSSSTAAKVGFMAGALPNEGLGLILSERVRESEQELLAPPTPTPSPTGAATPTPAGPTTAPMTNGQAPEHIQRPIIAGVAAHDPDAALDAVMRGNVPNWFSDSHGRPPPDEMAKMIDLVTVFHAIARDPARAMMIRERAGDPGIAAAAMAADTDSALAAAAHMAFSDIASDDDRKTIRRLLVDLDAAMMTRAARAAKGAVEAGKMQHDIGQVAGRVDELTARLTKVEADIDDIRSDIKAGFEQMAERLNAMERRSGNVRQPA